MAKGKPSRGTKRDGRLKGNKRLGLTKRKKTKRKKK
jgi:hypothetical protein